MDPSLVGVVIGTVIATLLAVLCAALVMTLIEVRLAARELRSTLARIVPALEETIANLRSVSATAAKATRAAEQAGPALERLRDGAVRLSAWMPLIAAASGLFSVMRYARSTRRTAESHDRR